MTDTKPMASERGASSPAAQRSASVSVEGVSKAFDHSRVQALDRIDLALHRGEFISLVGPSGCGKSTLFNIVAGLIKPDSGAVSIDGLDITGKTGHVGYMLQRDLLLPWRNVIDNVVIGLDIKGVPRTESYPRAHELLQRFGLGRFERSYPAALSGGMRQRCAVIRTILYDAPLFLLDEPFSALDAQTRLLMQEWLLDVWASLGKTVFYITHDVDEAIYLSDRVYAMSARPGRIIDAVEIPLARPREHEMRVDPAFIGLKARVTELVRAEAEKSMASELDWLETPR